MKSIVFDLDDTICFPNHHEKDTYRKYGLALPNPEVIESIYKLKQLGYNIIIHSARRMLTHNGDIDKILNDVLCITEDWLRDNGVVYDELIFGKPYSTTYYVDDKAMNLVQFDEWMKTQ